MFYDHTTLLQFSLNSLCKVVLSPFPQLYAKSKQLMPSLKTFLFVLIGLQERERDQKISDGIRIISDSLIAQRIFFIPAKHT